MGYRQELLECLSETQALYKQIEEQGLSAKVRHIHALRKDAFLAKYDDYFNLERYQLALNFVLSDVYSSLDNEKRDLKISTAFSSMSKVLPDSILETIAKAVSYNCNMLKLDAMLAAKESLTGVSAYEELLKDTDAKQASNDLVDDFVALANNIHVFTAKPFMQLTLKASRIPARAANLEELQDFLERCFTAFKKMRQPKAFLQDYKQRETL